MNHHELCNYLSDWLNRYPDRSASEDENAGARSTEALWLRRFADRENYSYAEVVELINWKFQSRKLYRDRALAGIAEDRWRHADERIRMAIRSESDVEAITSLLGSHGGIPFFGPAMSSVVLAANQPDRFTIADSQALAALRAIGVFPEGGRNFALADWPEYLLVCRRLASDCHLSLRELDQALWAARGSAPPLTLL